MITEYRAYNILIDNNVFSAFSFHVIEPLADGGKLAEMREPQTCSGAATVWRLSLDLRYLRDVPLSRLLAVGQRSAVRRSSNAFPPYPSMSATLSLSHW
jgi:hypothetical protein